MSEFTSNEIDEIMSSIGMQVANETVGRAHNDDTIDDDLVEALGKASKDQLYEAVDNMLDLLSVAELLNQALSDDGLLDVEETDELMEYITELEADTKSLITDLVPN